MLIRAARESDFDAVAAVVNHYIRETAIHFATDPVTPAELREAWWDHREVYLFLVAEVDGRFGGFSKAGTFRERAAYAWTTETTVYVARGMERKGLGKALYERLFAILRGQGFETAIGGIALPNEASVLLHESMGVREGRSRGSRRVEIQEVSRSRLLAKGSGSAERRPEADRPARVRVSRPVRPDKLPVHVPASDLHVASCFAAVTLPPV